MAKRRANGEGNIRKRKDGRWEGRYTARHDSGTGKRVFKNVLEKTQTECREKLKQAIQTAGRLEITVPETMTAGEWMGIWREQFGKLHMCPAIYANCEILIRLHIKPYIGGKWLSRLSKYWKVYQELVRSGHPASSTGSHLSFCAVFHWKSACDMVQ